VEGTTPQSKFYGLWQELGVIPAVKFVHFDEITRFSKKGKIFVFSSDINKLMYNMKEIAPEDGEVIEELRDAVLQFAGYDMELKPPAEIENVVQKISALAKKAAYLPRMNRYLSISAASFAFRFRNSMVRETLLSLFDLPDFSALHMILTLAMFHLRTPGYPIGGSRAFVNALSEKYLSLGGEFVFNKKVEKIRSLNEHITGITLSDGTKFAADSVIAACDGFSVISGMLAGGFVSEKLWDYYRKIPLYPPVVKVCLGINMDLKALPGDIIIIPEAPVETGNMHYEKIRLSTYCHDPGCAPAGRSVVSSEFMANYNFWVDASSEFGRYDFERYKYADFVIKALDGLAPGASEKIDAIEVITPSSIISLTGTRKGAYRGFQRSMKFPETRLKRTIEELKGFYMAGQWTAPGGGVAEAALTGREAVQLACASAGTGFKSDGAQDSFL
jgi:phytoene dehydrogenase-like protein